MAEADEDEINLESLKVLKEVFEAADEDGSGELDIDEFCAKLGPHLGLNLKRQQVAQLFMKIDADAGGTVDWEEFTNYMFLEKAQASAGEGAAENWRLFPADFRDKNEASAYHHEQVDKLFFCSTIDKYMTCGRDGTFRLWNAADLKHIKTINNGTSWITDCMYLPQSRKMVFTTMERAITYYDINRGSYDLTGRVYANGAMGVPMALHVLSGDAGERVVYGDTKGAAVLLLCGSRELPARDLISTDDHKDYIYLHKEHSDWVTKIQWIPEVGLVTSSLDTTIKTFDINRERILHNCTHHTKGVHSFVWCKAYSCFASCGLERDVTVWHGTTGRKVGELRGHTSSVSHIALDDNLNHVFTLSIDKSIKMWDLRNHKCLQTIAEDDWSYHGDSQPNCLMYDHVRRRLVTAAHRPYVWQHKVITQDRTGHREPLKGALYNSTFAVVVSVDEGGAVCVWNAQDGCRQGRFAVDHDGSRVTAISFDKKQRRLVTAANDGSIKMWNFNNGSALRSFAHDQDPLEISEVLFARDEKRGADTVYAAGWNAKVFVWEDQDKDEVTDYKVYEGHREDILAMAAYPKRQLLATGDYQGHISIWNLFTGERKSWLSHRAERCETSVERLLWVSAFSPQQRQAAAARAAAARAAALSASATSLAIGASGNTSSFFLGQSHSQQQPGGSAAAAAAGSKGPAGVPLVIVPSQLSIAADIPLLDINVSKTPKGQHQLHHHQQQFVVADKSSNDIANADLSDSEDMEEPDALLMLSAGGDGVCQVWKINHLGQGQLLCTLPGAQGVLDVVSAVNIDEQATAVVLGDSAGHLRVYDISAGIDTSSSDAAAASFIKRAHWQAHEGGISSVDIVPSRPNSGLSSCGATAAAAMAVGSTSSYVIPALIVSASRDANVAVWTLDGGLVGVLGEHSWDLDNQDTWQDPKGLRKKPPRPADDGLYVKSASDKEQQQSDASSTADPGQDIASSSSATGHLGKSGIFKIAARQAGRLAAHLLSAKALQQQSKQFGAQLVQPAAITIANELGGLSKATLIMQERKQKMRDSMVAKPEQPHCQLHIHELNDVDGTANEILKAAADKRRAKAAAAGGRHFNHSASGNSSWSGMSHVTGRSGFNWRQPEGRR